MKRLLFCILDRGNTKLTSEPRNQLAPNGLKSCATF